MVFGMVLRTFVCALFGAIFGYILGRGIELFAGVSQAAGLPALLAAAGLLAGTALGIIVSILIYWAWHGRHSKLMRRWAGRFGYSFGHSHWHPGRYKKHRGNMRSPWSDPVDDSLEEMDGYISYLEDLPKDRLASCEDKIVRLNDRLQSLKASLDQNKSI